MIWSRKKRFRRGQEAGTLSPGRHHSPGLELVLGELERADSPAVLDLGPSSRENLEAFAEFTDDLLIQDCFHRVGVNGQRGEIFDFGPAADVELPERTEAFDLIFAWDLLHYFSRPEAIRFAARLEQRLAPGGLILVHASTTVPIPPSPIQFKYADRKHLDYELDPGRVPSPTMPIRVVEKMLAGCSSVRIFQLRNGLQEFVLRR
ncbi:MAG: class I SAM-dependent methyltransferase, partial [Acidobacteriota bacterium]